MKKLLLSLAFLFIPSIAWAQCNGVFPANTLCGNLGASPAPPAAFSASTVNTSPASSVPGDIVTFSNFTGGLIQDQGNGVFNVRLSYGAVPDGTTDNTAAIVSAFTAANTYVTSNNTYSIPTVYFDCGKTTTCVYNYSGATSSGSISAINPTTPMTIRCNTGVALNYNGTGHAADIGKSGLVLGTTIGGRYTIEGCQWTGGSGYTAGLYLQDHNIFVSILNNQFFNFGATSTFTIVISGNTWEPLIMGNQWIETNGVATGVLDSHLSSASPVIFTKNQMECILVTCTESAAGVGLWVAGATITDNVIQNHRPDIRIASSTGTAGILVIRDNHFETNSPSNTPIITYGDPGGTGTNIGSSNTCTIDSNYFLNTGLISGVPEIGPETAGSGSHTLNGCRFENNFFTLPIPSGGAAFINTNQGQQNVVGYNFANSGALTIGTSPPIIDTGFAQQKAFYPAVTAQPGTGAVLTSMQNALAAYDANAAFLTPAGIVNVATALDCPNSTSSNTQSCSTPAGIFQVPATGNMILYRSTFTNTGAVSLNVLGSGLANVKKNGGASNLSAGDLQSGVTYPLIFDGTNWQLTANTKNVENVAQTFASITTSFGGMQVWISDGRGGGCGDGTCTTWGTGITSGGGTLPLLIWNNGTSGWTLVGK